MFYTKLIEILKPTYPLYLFNWIYNLYHDMYEWNLIKIC